MTVGAGGLSGRAVNEQSPSDIRLLSTETVKAILMAPKQSEQSSGIAIDRLRIWLSTAFNAAAKRATQTPLCQKDVYDLRTAYDSFQSKIASLQDRDHPPPTIPVTDGATDWEHWFSAMHIGFKLGRDDGCDWKLIAQLLAVYEAVTQGRASGARENNPTLRFLCSAIELLGLEVDMELRSYFRPPKADALRKQLPRLRGKWMRAAAKQLSEIWDAPTGEK